MGGIGDLVLFTPALKILKNNFPDASIDIFTGYTISARDIFTEGNVVNKIFKFDFAKSGFLNRLKFIFQLRREKYNLAIVTTSVNPLMGSFFAFLTGTKTRVGEYRKAKLTFYTNQVKLDADKHKIETNLNLLKALNIKVKTPVPPPFFETGADDKKFAEEFVKKNNLENKILIGIFPGASPKQQFKAWPKENFIELGRKILSNIPNAFIIIFGSLNEKEECFQIKNSLGEKAIIITGCPLKQAAALIDKCKIFVASDSGLSHVAATTNANLIAICGPTISERTGPVGPRVHIIKEKCSYQYHDVFTKNYDFNRKHQCLKKISPDRVLNKAKEILNIGEDGRIY
jgi:ADP-heptose:LPS heptosyltransferase